MIKVTIFTPAYNRAHLLSALYESLLSQTNKSFEWLIIDDGSADNTSEVVASMISENKISIKYNWQSNAGKHIALNKGVELSSGELFYIVDSDDILPDNAIEIVLHKYKTVENKPDCSGICGRKYYPDGKPIGSDKSYDDMYISFMDFRYKYKMEGDMAEVFKTEVLKKFPFPQFESEKFCPEALVWNRIANEYKMLFFNQNIYIAEYLPDGLSAKIVKVRTQSPNASMLYYSELAKYKIPSSLKFKSAINYWRFSYYSSKSFKERFAEVGFLKSIIGSIAGYMYYKWDSR